MTQPIIRRRRRPRRLIVIDRLTAVAIVSAVLCAEVLVAFGGWILAVGVPRREVVVALPAPKPAPVVVAAAVAPPQPRPMLESPLDRYMLVSTARPKTVWVRSTEVASEEAGPYRDLIEIAARRHALSPSLVEAVARVESNFDPNALSPKGARGLMQVMPRTAERFGIMREDLWDPTSNLAAGTAYLANLLDRYQGDLDLALAAYNAGEGAVQKHGGIPPYRETRNYVRRVREVLRRNEEGTPAYQARIIEEEAPQIALGELQMASAAY